MKTYKKELTPKEDIVYSLKPNTHTINQYSNNIIDLAFGFPYGFCVQDVLSYLVKSK